MLSTGFKFIVAVIALTLVSGEQAFGYIDPGTGSLVIQGVVAALLGSLVVLKLYWHKIVSLFHGKSAAAGKDAEEDKK